MNGYDDDYSDSSYNSMGYDPRTDSEEAEKDLAYSSADSDTLYANKNMTKFGFEDGEAIEIMLSPGSSWEYEPAQHGGRDDPSWDAYYYLDGSILFRGYDEDGHPQGDWIKAEGDIAEVLESLWHEQIGT